MAHQITNKLLLVTIVIDLWATHKDSFHLMSNHLIKIFRYRCLIIVLINIKVHIQQYLIFISKEAKTFN
jgi:hypothetical protein